MAVLVVETLWVVVGHLFVGPSLVFMSSAVVTRENFIVGMRHGVMDRVGGWSKQWEWEWSCSFRYKGLSQGGHLSMPARHCCPSSSTHWWCRGDLTPAFLHVGGWM